MNPNCRHEVRYPNETCQRCIEVGCHACQDCAQIRAIEAAHGDGARIWNTAQLQEDFEVRGFGMGLCVVKRKSDGSLGSLEFTHMPRFYFNFILHEA